MPGERAPILLNASRVKRAHAAMEIADRRTVQPTGDGRKYRIAEIAVKRRHCARLDAARKAVAHDQLGAILQLVDEVVELAPVVGIVGIGHDQIFAARRPAAALIAAPYPLTG